MTLYGKDALKRILDNTAAKGRLPHAIMLSGAAGSGRKTTARYIAQQLLCENSKNGAPCGTCQVCRHAEANTLPDLIFVKQRLRDEKYAIEPFRELLREADIKPGTQKFKIYVFEDCDEMTPLLHNTLLKLIEEPQPHLRFIFTAENTSAIPETVISRVTEFEVPDTTIPDCVRCLTDEGADPQKASELAELFSGNIGRCKMMLSGTEKENASEMAAIDTARRAAYALGCRDPFGFAAIFAEQSARAKQAARAEFNKTFRLLSRILRDALALKHGAAAESLAKSESQMIAAAFSAEKLLDMLDAAAEIEGNEIYNLNIALTATYFISKAF